MKTKKLTKKYEKTKDSIFITGIVFYEGHTRFVPVKYQSVKMTS